MADEDEIRERRRRTSELIAGHQAEAPRPFFDPEVKLIRGDVTLIVGVDAALKPTLPRWPGNPTAERQFYRRSGGSCNGDGASITRASGLTVRWSPSERKTGAFRCDLDAVLPLPSTSATDAASDAQHRAGGGDGRRAAIAARIFPSSARGTMTSAIWKAIERPCRTIQATTIDHRPHRRIMRETLGVGHVLIAGEAPEHGLPQQPAQQMPRVPATAAFRQRAAGQIGQPEPVVQFPVGQQVGVGGDAAAVELEPQATVKIDPQGAIIRFTRRVVHRAITQAASTY